MLFSFIHFQMANLMQIDVVVVILQVLIESIS